MRWATMTFALVVVLVTAPACTGFKAGEETEVGLEVIDRGDYATALKELRPLAEQGNATAQNNLGVMYREGEGVPQDDEEAVRWYRRAAVQGHAGAQNNLGLMYAEGRGVPPDDKEAARWFRLAAAQGDAKAQYNLGLMYAEGQGVPQDVVQAHLWMNLAAAQGDEDASKTRDLLAELMTRAQLADAQRLAREWKPKE